MLYRILAIFVLSVTAATAQVPAKPVKLMTVDPTAGALVRQFFGLVVARQTVDLAFQVSGQIVEFPAIEGESIPKGGLIALLDLEPFERQLSQAMLQKDQADRNLVRLEQLRSSAVSQVSIDDARTDAEMSAISVRSAQYDLEHARLTAPFDALVATRNMANFTTVQAGSPVVRLHDMSELRIDIDVPEILFQRAGEDPDVVVTAKFPTSDQDFPLEVREFNAETSAIGQTFSITFALPQQEGLAVLPGSSVTVTTRLNGGPSVITVPAAALKPGADGAQSVLVFKPGDGDLGTLEERVVEAQVSDRGGFEVVSGLEAGEEIVSAGVMTLSDGQAVRRFTGFSN
ncbi:MAG: efflux RND transporter periplasmic adaptor subunit [Pseudomonadota bacterium]